MNPIVYAIPVFFLLMAIEIAVASLAERLVTLATQDAELRTALRQLAGAYLQATEQPVAPLPVAQSLADQVQATLQTLETVVAQEANPPAAELRGRIDQLLSSFHTWK